MNTTNLFNYYPSDVRDVDPQTGVALTVDDGERPVAVVFDSAAPVAVHTYMEYSRPLAAQLADGMGGMAVNASMEQQ